MDKFWLLLWASEASYHIVCIFQCRTKSLWLCVYIHMICYFRSMFHIHMFHIHLFYVQTLCVLSSSSAVAPICRTYYIPYRLSMCDCFVNASLCVDYMKITAFIACISALCGIIPISNGIETMSVVIEYICVFFWRVFNGHDIRDVCHGCLCVCRCNVLP